MAPGLDISITNTALSEPTTKSQTQHVENSKPSKKENRLSSQTKNFSAADFAIPPSNLLQASPYSEHQHLLDLATLARPLQLFAEALTGMRSIMPDYATAPYPQAFNWDSIVDVYSRAMRAELQDEVPEPLSFYVIVFRSKVNERADRQLLGELDKAAHVEAVVGGGLLKYWFGTPDQNGRNLATCLWRDRADARRGGAGPGHALAMRAASTMYNEWFVERLRLTVDPKAGSWSFTTWVDDLEQAV